MTDEVLELERLDAETVARAEEPLLRLVPEGERPHSVETLDESQLSAKGIHESAGQQSTGIERAELTDVQKAALLKANGILFDELQSGTMLAKVITRGATRQQAIARMQEALDMFAIEGVKTNIAFARQVLANAIIDGGYRPVLLHPIDFVAVYRERMKRQQAGAAPLSVPKA